jgi:5-deoxy-glucuronate isomerase
MNLLIKAKRYNQEIAVITPESAGWRYVGFSAYRIAQGQELVLPALSSRECCLIVLAGIVSVEAGDLIWEKLGRRQCVFENIAPYAIYLPPGFPLTITAIADAEIGIASAPAQGVWEPRLIEPESMRQSVRGTGSNMRNICDILSQEALAESLLVVEVRTPSGHSSSYPPHKHDVDNYPQESLLEETYYHRIQPSQGFVFQRIYTDSRETDVSLCVEDRDVVLVPHGYHPVVAPHGYESYYLNVMAGPKRVWCFHNDPAHEWILGDNARH